MAPDRPIPAGTTPGFRLLFFLKVSEMDAVAVAWGNTLLALSVLGTAGAWIAASPPRIHLGAAPVAAGSLLRLLRCL